MTHFGLDERALELIRGVFRAHPEVEAVRVYGSRALGTHRPNSDVDLVIWGELDDLRLVRIAGELDDLPLPYKFDVSLYHRIEHEGLRRHIDEHAIGLFAVANEST